MNLDEALDPSTPAARLEALLHPSLRDDTEFAADPSLALLEQERLSDHPDPRVRRALARNDSLAPHLVRSLSADPDAWVRRQIAARSDVPPRLLRALQDDEAIEVRDQASKSLARRAQARRARSPSGDI